MLTSDDICELSDQYDGEYLKFDLIPKDEQLHPSGKLCGILKLVSLMTEPSGFTFQAEHDELFLCGLDELATISEEDFVYLNRCGLSFDDEVEQKFSGIHLLPVLRCQV